MLNVSIVLYHTDIQEVKILVDVLRSCPHVNTIFLIDNSETRNQEFETLSVTHLFNGKNLGYGAGHNIAIRQTLTDQIPYHLVVNSDISFQPESIGQLIDFMENNKDIGSLMPKIFYPDGKIQYLCKLIPTPLDLFGRRFLPRKWMQKRVEHFELRQFGYDKTMDVPYLSGCFMLLRSEALQKVGLFDERFFMYPEDIDLTRRIREHYRTVFYPKVSVIHNHAQGSYKDKKLLWIHIINLIKYFNKWGWWCDKKRKQINKETINQFK
ncbi:MAG TPA: glycosyltransferase family 2 protein [Paludibacteraceae bacterium]|nr:glycosyltransferase family 2 protein [Paludibacteraceae bacterium]